MTLGVQGLPGLTCKTTTLVFVEGVLDKLLDTMEAMDVAGHNTTQCHTRQLIIVNAKHLLTLNSGNEFLYVCEKVQVCM